MAAMLLCLLVLVCPVDPLGPVNLAPEMLPGPDHSGYNGNRDDQENKPSHDDLLSVLQQYQWPVNEKGQPRC
jgi:hypothetical protein